MNHECDHKEGTTPKYDHVTCDKCGMVFTDSGWGIASLKWFRNIDEAKFYKRTGRRPE